MADRLAEIKEQWKHTATEDGLWLITEVERLKAIPFPRSSAAHQLGIAEGMEAAAAAVRASCDNCDLDGHDVHGDECAYCGIPMKAIRAAAKEQA